MRFFGIFSILLLAVGAGCACGPSCFGPSLGGNPYNACIGNNAIAPPFAMGTQGKNHRPTLSERKQSRELKRWYRELNDKPSQSYEEGDFCPDCQRKHRNRRRSGFNSGSYDEWAYNDGMSTDGMIYDGYYDGQIIDGAVFDGEYTSGGYCPDCQGDQVGQPTFVDPTPVAPAPPVPSEPNAHFVPANEYYSPPTLISPTSTTPVPSPVKQVSIPPVEQMLYAPPVQE
jgi:hypothetical protein